MTAVDGAVTLGGHVSGNHEKHAAVRAAERITSVRAVADDIVVRPVSLHVRADDEIAETIARLRGQRPHSPDSVGVQVRDGRVILHGMVSAESERAEVENAARQLAGVRAVDNLIEVEPETNPITTELERLIQEAVATVADDDARSIRVTMDDGTAHLAGRVRSLAALQAAIDAARTAPEVTGVTTEIVVTVQD